MKMDTQTIILFIVFASVVVCGLFQSCSYNETNINNYYYPIVEDNLTPEELELVRLLNQYRESKGLNPLIPEKLACEVCDIRNLQDIENNLHPSHLHWSQMMIDAKVNIGDHLWAYNYATPQDLLNGYLSSHDHREALENPNRTHIGTSFINRRNHTIIVRY